MYGQGARRSNRGASLEQLVQEGQISEDGKNWLYEALDPFHDKPIQPTGRPDSAVGGSVVQRIMKTMTIAKPAAVTGTANWDCHVVMWNDENDEVASANSTVWEQQDPQFPASLVPKGSPAAQVFKPVGLTAYSCQANQPTYMGGSSTQYSVSRISAEDENDNFLGGNCRVVGKGFEVVNSTAEIYKQGSVTWYRQPTPAPNSHCVYQFHATSSLEAEKLNEAAAIEERNRRRELLVRRGFSIHKKTFKEVEAVESEACKRCSREIKDSNSSKMEKGPMAFPGYYGAISTYVVQTPPETQKAATLLIGSQTDEAKGGVYCVAPMNCDENPPKQKLPMVVGVLDRDVLGDGANGEMMTWSAASSLSVVSSAYTQHISPFDMVGAYFVGLSPETTLTITGIWYVERFPTPTDADLAVLARMSPGFDPKALEIYGRALHLLPIGCPQGLNPLGEWFKGVLDVARDYAIPAAKVVGNFVPGVGAAATVADTIEKSLRPIVKQGKKKETLRKAKKKTRKQAKLPNITQPTAPKGGK